jgi:photosystem II stability/assembly factor-like uncharacterized protein
MTYLPARAQTAGAFLWKTEDGGHTWTAADPGPPHNLLFDLKSAGSRLYAITQTDSGEFRVLVSADRAQSWQSLDQLNLAGASTVEAAIAPGNPDTVYLGRTGDNPKSVQSPAFIASTDGGATTSEFIAAGLTLDADSNSWCTIVVHPNDAATLYAGTGCVPTAGSYIYTENGGLWKSQDGARTWTMLNWSVFESILIDPSTPTTMYANVTDTAAQLSKSVDGGQTWTVKLPGASGALAMDPRDPSVLYAGAGAGGLWKSTDYGESWNQVYNATPVLFFNRLAVSPADSSTLYAEVLQRPSFELTVKKSEDGGASWTTVLLLDPHARTVLTPFQILFDANLPDTVYVGTYQRYAPGN